MGKKGKKEKRVDDCFFLTNQDSVVRLLKIMENTIRKPEVS